MSDSEDDDESSESDDESWQVSFPHLDAKIRAVIEKYEGAVFPKLNWSSPQVSVSSLVPFRILSYV